MANAKNGSKSISGDQMSRQWGMKRIPGSSSASSPIRVYKMGIYGKIMIKALGSSENDVKVPSSSNG
jgi:hypothetical protein